MCQSHPPLAGVESREGEGGDSASRVGEAWGQRTGPESLGKLCRNWDFMCLSIFGLNSVLWKFLGFCEEPTLNIEGHLRACYKDQCEQGGGHLKMGYEDFSCSC